MIPKEVIEHLSSIGVEFALPDDAAAAVMHVAVDKSINGMEPYFNQSYITDVATRSCNRHIAQEHRRKWLSRSGT
jgi:hypothetical protein